MPLKVLVVPDKFKGTLTARVAAELIAQGWHATRPSDQLDLLPMSDGGDGFGEVMSGLLSAEVRTAECLDASHRPRLVQWWWEPGSKTAVIESAQVIGLALLPQGRHHPFELDTLGVGALLEAAAELGAAQCLIGIGGSATNDGGFGLARSLRWTFLGQDGQPIEKWIHLDTLDRIIPPESSRGLPPVLVAVDVQNPLLGPTGASRVYGPQKGLRVEDMPHAERCLERLRTVSERDLGLTPHAVPGDGAAGGLGFGLRCFAAGQLESGFKVFARRAGLEARIGAAELVITGEGAIDDSTRMGKGVGEVADLCRKHRVPCLGLAGAVANDLHGQSWEGKFTRVYGIAPGLTDLDEAKRAAALWLPRLAAEAARGGPFVPA